ncbi:SurA N-terminal domain-containing protein [Candidatus Dojkabacteria bacterium]|nr:SurA N-terminal domain-containing protein [Candidatus Dojkabacteria bacterium]
MAAKKRTSRRKPQPKKQIKTQNKTQGPRKASKNILQAFVEFFNERRFLRNTIIWILIFFASLTIVDFGVQYLNYHASAAVVNGKRISMSRFYDKLQETYGNTVIAQLIDEELIHQEGKAQDVKIDEEEIDKEIETLESSYGGKENLDSELEDRNLTRDELRRQIETTLIAQEILGKEISITESEKKDFYDEYKDLIVEGNDDPTYEEAEDRIVEILTEQKISEKVQPWLEELRSDAKIHNNIESPKKYQFLRITKSLVNDLIEKILPEEKKDN